MTTLDEAIERFENNAEFERRNGNLQGCLDFRQLAEWLKDYKRLLEQEPCDDVVSIQAVIEWLKDKDIIKMSSQEKTARKELKAFLSVRPQERTGKFYCQQITRSQITSVLHIMEMCEGIQANEDETFAGKETAKVVAYEHIAEILKGVQNDTKGS